MLNKDIEEYTCEEILASDIIRNISGGSSANITSDIIVT